MTWKYLRHVLRHKWLVFLECLGLGLPLWTALFHDWDKFLPDEWSAFSRAFNGHKYAESQEFLNASNRHMKRNTHHWQHYVLFRDRGDVVILEMPDAARREMLADWRAVSKSTGSSLSQWYEDSVSKMRLHPTTKRWLVDQVNGPSARIRKAGRHGEETRQEELDCRGNQEQGRVAQEPGR